LKKLITSDYNALESDIDSIYFGVKSAKVYLFNGILSKIEQDKLIVFLDSFDFVTIFNKNNHPENCLWIGSRTNAFLSDINIQLEKTISESFTNDDNEVEISDNFPFNKNIIKIAETAFTYSRFINDQNLNKMKAKHIYADITRNAFNKPERFFCVIKKLNKIAGYSLFSFKGDRAIIELIAIDDIYRGQKIGKVLINNLEHFSYLSRFKFLQVGTQLNNLSAINFYLSMGFKPIEINSIYHYWPSLRDFK